MSRLDWLLNNNNKIYEEPIPVPPAILMILDLTGSINNFDQKSLDHRLAAYLWWLYRGQKHYVGARWELSRTDRIYVQRKFDHFARNPENLIESFPDTFHQLATTPTDQSNVPRKLIETLTDADFCVDSDNLTLPLFLVGIFNSRIDLHGHTEIKTIVGKCSLLQWWHDIGHKQYCGISWCYEKYISNVREKFSQKSDSKIKKFPVFIEEILSTRPDVLAASNSQSKDTLHFILDWWNVGGRFEYPFLGHIKFSIGMEKEKQKQSEITEKQITLPVGTNIVGFFASNLGIGEDARTVASALEMSDTNYCFRPCVQSGPSLDIADSDFRTSLFLKFDTTIFCLPATEMFRLATEGGDSLIEFPSYKIGFSPWELPHWPLEYRHCLNFFDEIWAQSEFVRAAFEPVTDKKIIKMPMCVEVPAVKNSIRERWHLNEDKFYFFMIFDGNSWIQRKNPIAALRAFQRAFNQRDKDVSLVIKLINPRQSSDQWYEFLNIISSDDRMILIQDNMPRDELIDLFDACDAYVSLHRSEGFGRTIAEAMLLQKPVIATNFSGNVDFCRPDTCYLVDGELIPVEKGDYLFHEGQYWCDPDIDIAAQKMVLVRENINDSKKFTQKAFNFVEQHYSRKAVTDWMLSRLAEIKGTN